MEYPGLLNWANSIRQNMANDPGRQLFKDQVQSHGFSFLDDYLADILSGRKQDPLIELVKTPGRKKAALRNPKLMMQVIQHNQHNETLPQTREVLPVENHNEAPKVPALQFLDASDHVLTNETLPQTREVSPVENHNEAPKVPALQFLDTRDHVLTDIQEEDVEMPQKPTEKPDPLSFPTLPEPMPLRKSMKPPRDPSVDAVLLGAATPGAPVGGKRTSWLMKAREAKALEKRSHPPEIGSVGASFSLNLQGTKRKSDPFSLSQLGIRDDGRPPKLAKTSEGETFSYDSTDQKTPGPATLSTERSPVIVESAQEGVFDLLKRTVEDFGVRVGEAIGKSVGSDTATALAEARAAAKAKVAERDRKEEELTMALLAPATTRSDAEGDGEAVGKSVGSDTATAKAKDAERDRKEEEEPTMALPVPATTRSDASDIGDGEAVGKSVGSDTATALAEAIAAAKAKVAERDRKEEELTMALPAPATTWSDSVGDVGETVGKSVGSDTATVLAEAIAAAKAKVAERDRKEDEELTMALPAPATTRSDDLGDVGQAVGKSVGSDTATARASARAAAKAKVAERDRKEEELTMALPAPVTARLDDLGDVGETVGKSVGSDTATALAEARAAAKAKVAERDLKEEELTMALPAPTTTRSDDLGDVPAWMPSSQDSALGTSKKTEVKKVLQMAAVAAKKQQEEADKKVVRLKEMESRRQLAIQRKAEEERAKVLEEERKMKEEVERRKREREELTDKRPIKPPQAGKKKEVEKKPEIKKPPSSTLIGKAHLKSALKPSSARNPPHAFGLSSSQSASTAPPEVSFSNSKEQIRLAQKPVDDEVSQPSMLVQSQMAARVKARIEAATRAEPVIPSENIELPEINSEYSDSEDEDRVRTFDPPEWAQSPELRQALEMQSTMNPDDIFGAVRPLKMEELFKSRTSRFRARTSSANWTGTDRLTMQEEREYARRMGFK